MVLTRRAAARANAPNAPPLPKPGHRKPYRTKSTADRQLRATKEKRHNAVEMQALSAVAEMFQRASVAAAAYKHERVGKRAYHIRNKRLSKTTRRVAVGAIAAHHHGGVHLVEVDVKRPYGKKKRSSNRAFYVFPLSGRGDIMKVRNPHGPKDAAIMAKLLGSASTTSHNRFVIMRRAHRGGRPYAKMDIVELRRIGIRDQVFPHRDYTVRRIGSVSGQNMFPVSLSDVSELFDEASMVDKFVYNVNNGKVFRGGVHVAGTGRPRKQRARKARSPKATAAAPKKKSPRRRAAAAGKKRSPVVRRAGVRSASSPSARRSRTTRRRSV